MRRLSVLMVALLAVLGAAVAVPGVAAAAGILRDALDVGRRHRGRAEPVAAGGRADRFTRVRRPGGVPHRGVGRCGLGRAVRGRGAHRRVGCGAGGARWGAVGGPAAPPGLRRAGDGDVAAPVAAGERRGRVPDAAVGGLRRVVRGLHGARGRHAGPATVPRLLGGRPGWRHTDRAGRRASVVTVRPQLGCARSPTQAAVGRPQAPGADRSIGDGSGCQRRGPGPRWSPAADLEPDG